MDIWQPLFPRMSMMEVQTILTRLGFDPGACDGRYGPCTRDAVRQCQAAYRLVVDGVPGPELKRLLSQDLPSCRVTTRVREGQTLSGVARALGTTVEALLEGNRRKRYEDVYPGETLIIHRRAAGVFIEPWDKLDECVSHLDVASDFPWTFALLPMFSIAGTGEILSDSRALLPLPGLAGSAKDDLVPMGASGRIADRGHGRVENPLPSGPGVSVLPGIRESAAAKTDWQKGSTRIYALLAGPADIKDGTLALLKSRRAQMAAEVRSMVVEAAMSGVAGVALDIPGIGDDEYFGYSRFVRFLARECRRLGMELALILPAPPVPGSRSAFVEGSGDPPGPVQRLQGHARRLPWPGGYDIELFGSIADLILLDIKDPASFWDSIVWACEYVPRWKLAAVVELRACRPGPSGHVPMGREEFRSFLARHVVRKGRDELSGVPYLMYRSRGVLRRAWQEDAESLGRKLHAVNRLNILGVVFRGAWDTGDQVIEEVSRRFIIM